MAEVLELSHLSGIFEMYESVDAAQIAAWPWAAIRAGGGRHGAVRPARLGRASHGRPSSPASARRSRRRAHRRRREPGDVQHRFQPFIELGKLVAAALIGILVTAVHQPSSRDRAGGRSMEQAQMLLCVSGALMMIIIGNSLARAFGIAGAASIIRFRTPVDDPKDVTILFLLMGLGMSTGLGAFAVAGLGTAFLCMTLVALDAMAKQQTRLMSVEIVAERPQFPTTHVEEVFARNQIVFEPREIAQSDDVTVKYHTWLDPRTSLDDLSSQLMRDAPGVTRCGLGAPETRMTASGTAPSPDRDRDRAVDRREAVAATSSAGPRRASSCRSSAATTTTSSTELTRAVERGVTVDVLVTSRARAGRSGAKAVARARGHRRVASIPHTDPVVKYHAKYLVADDGPALVASLNFTRKCFAKTIDAIVVTHDPAVVSGLRALMTPTAAKRADARPACRRGSSSAPSGRAGSSRRSSSRRTSSIRADRREGVGSGADDAAAGSAATPGCGWTLYDAEASRRSAIARQDHARRRRAGGDRRAVAECREPRLPARGGRDVTEPAAVAEVAEPVRDCRRERGRRRCRRRSTKGDARMLSGVLAGLMALLPVGLPSAAAAGVTLARPSRAQAPAAGCRVSLARSSVAAFRPAVPHRLPGQVPVGRPRPGDDPPDFDTFEIHRARVGIEGEFFNHVQFSHRARAHRTRVTWTDPNPRRTSAWKDVYVERTSATPRRCGPASSRFRSGSTQLTGISNLDFVFRSLSASYLAPAQGHRRDGARPLLRSRSQLLGRRVSTGRR